MKKLFFTFLVSVALFINFSTAYAVEYIVTFPDKSQLFRCEMHGATFKVKVKMLQIGKYRTIVIGKGISGYSGIVYADNFTNAARTGCGGE